jgi:hypothetical protein
VVVVVVVMVVVAATGTFCDDSERTLNQTKKASTYVEKQKSNVPPARTLTTAVLMARCSTARTSRGERKKSDARTRNELRTAKSVVCP